MKHLEIKGKVFGQGKPLICVPVMDTEKEDIVQEIKCLVDKKVDIIEWRVDAFAGINSLNAIREVFQEVKPLLNDTVFLFTFRSKEQGGRALASASLRNALSSRFLLPLRQVHCP